jgi:hypothetical protein
MEVIPLTTATVPVAVAVAPVAQDLIRHKISSAGMVELGLPPTLPEPLTTMVAVAEAE